MTLVVTSPVTGGAGTGFTSPTYTLSTDVAPDVNGRQYAVTALGGTQTGVRTHAVSDPFTLTLTRPKSPKALGSPNAVTGKYNAVPKNTYGIIARKGTNFAVNNAPLVTIARLSIDVPAGADAYDAPNVRALVCLLSGALFATSAGVGDTLATGIM